MVLVQCGSSAHYIKAVDVRFLLGYSFATKSARRTVFAKLRLRLRANRSPVVHYPSKLERSRAMRCACKSIITHCASCGASNLGSYCLASHRRRPAGGNLCIWGGSGLKYFLFIKYHSRSKMYNLMKYFSHILRTLYCSEATKTIVKSQHSNPHIIIDHVKNR